MARAAKYNDTVMSDNEYERAEELLRGMGLVSADTTVKRLRRLAKRHHKRYRRMTGLLDDVTVNVVKQTPTSHVFICDRNGEFESVFVQPEIIFLAKPLDVPQVESLYREHFGEPLPDTTINERLHRVVKAKLLPLREEPANPAAGPAVNCGHMLYRDKKKKAVYFVGADAQTSQLAQALAPFVNFTRRSRVKSDDFLVSDSLALLQKTRHKLIKLLSSEHAEKEEDVPKKRTHKKNAPKKPKKAKKPTGDVPVPVVEKKKKPKETIVQPEEKTNTKKRSLEEKEDVPVERKKVKISAQKAALTEESPVLAATVTTTTTKTTTEEKTQTTVQAVESIEGELDELDALEKEHSIAPADQEEQVKSDVDFTQWASLLKVVTSL